MTLRLLGALLLVVPRSYFYVGAMAENERLHGWWNEHARYTYMVIGTHKFLQERLAPLVQYAFPQARFIIMISFSRA